MIELSVMNIASTHNELITALHKANKSFSVQMIPLVMITMTISIFTTFQFYRVYVQYDQKNLLQAINNLMWVSMIWKFLLFVICRANDFLEEVSSFGLASKKLFRKQRDSPLSWVYLTRTKK